MNGYNLGTVFGPCILYSKDTSSTLKQVSDISKVANVVKCMIENHPNLFVEEKPQPKEEVQKRLTVIIQQEELAKCLRRETPPSPVVDRRTTKSNLSLFKRKASSKTVSVPWDVDLQTLIRKDLTTTELSMLNLSETPRSLPNSPSNSSDVLA
jgi:hypothetical protein